MIANNYDSVFGGKFHRNSLFLYLPTSLEIQNIIKFIRKLKAPGFDSVTPY